MGKYRSHGWHLILFFVLLYIVAVFGTGTQPNSFWIGASIGVLLSWFLWLINYGFDKYRKWRVYRDRRSS